MKNFIHSILVFFGLILASCASDKDDDPNSPSPTTDDRDKYVAVWNVNENSAVAGTNTHTVNIIKSSSSSSEIIINNFSGLSASARASVSNNNITIPYQQIGTVGFAKGSGTMNGANLISLTYTTTLPSGRDSCTATYTK